MTRVDALVSLIFVICVCSQILAQHPPFEAQEDPSSRNPIRDPSMAESGIDSHKLTLTGDTAASDTSSKGEGAMPGSGRPVASLRSQTIVSTMGLKADHVSSNSRPKRVSSSSSLLSVFPYQGSKQNPEAPNSPHSSDTRESVSDREQEDRLKVQTIPSVFSSARNKADSFRQADSSQSLNTAAKRHAADIHKRAVDVVIEPKTVTESSRDAAGVVTISSILRNTFLGQNLPFPFGQYYSVFANEALVPDVDSHSQGFKPTALTTINNENEVRDYQHGDNSAGQSESEDSAFVVEQRSQRCSIPDVLVGDEELPWTCRQSFRWRHLGEHVYPSRLYEAVCEGGTCWYGHFNCTPITYTLHVLQACLYGCHDLRVPSPLRSRWQWTDLNVTVGCQCVR